MIRERGREYGASTGRPRRCGWFDAFRHALRSGDQWLHFRRTNEARRARHARRDQSLRRLQARRKDVCESLPAVSQDLRRVEPIYATLTWLEEFNRWE